MTDFYQNDKNSQNNSSGVHSDAELDSNHNQLNGKAVIDLMVQRDEAGQQMHVSFQLLLPIRRLLRWSREGAGRCIQGELT